MRASFSVKALHIHAFVFGQPQRSKPRGRVCECWESISLAFCILPLPYKHFFVIFLILLIVQTSFCDFINFIVIVQTSFCYFINFIVIVQTSFNDFPKFVDCTK
jgi:hypothetical protein